MLDAGGNADEISKIFDVSRAIVYRWKQVYHRHGAGIRQSRVGCLAW
ncbi:MAG: helix-turn-helix domain-containing protein [Streptosporangiaceae bacterium]